MRRTVSFSLMFDGTDFFVNQEGNGPITLVMHNATREQYAECVLASRDELDKFIFALREIREEVWLP